MVNATPVPQAKARLPWRFCNDRPVTPLPFVITMVTGLSDSRVPVRAVGRCCQHKDAELLKTVSVVLAPAVNPPQESYRLPRAVLYDGSASIVTA